MPNDMPDVAVIKIADEYQKKYGVKAMIKDIRGINSIYMSAVDYLLKNGIRSVYPLDIVIQIYTYMPWLQPETESRINKTLADIRSDVNNHMHLLVMSLDTIDKIKRKHRGAGYPALLDLIWNDLSKLYNADVYSDLIEAKINDYTGRDNADGDVTSVGLVPGFFSEMKRLVWRNNWMELDKIDVDRIFQSL